MVKHQPQCHCTEDQILAAIRSLEAQRDTYIRSINQKNADIGAGVITRLQDDIAALRDLASSARDTADRRSWQEQARVRDEAVAASSGRDGRQAAA